MHEHEGPRVFPQAIESEQALLGGLIRDPNQLELIAGDLSVADFHRPDHARLYELLLEMMRGGEAIDETTLTERMRRGEGPEMYGGLMYVLQLGDNTPSTANLQTYAAIVRDKAVLRKIIETCQDLSNRAHTHVDAPSDILGSAARAFSDLGREDANRTWSQVSEVIDDEIARMEQLQDAEDGVVGTTTGLTDLDGKLAGFNATDLIILAARPAMGKTALALNFVQNAAILGQKAVGVFSLEMSRGQLVTRMLTCMAEVEAGKVRTGNLSSDDWDSLLDCSEQMRKLPIFIEDTPNLTIHDIRARARRLAAAHDNLGLIVIDYLQLMQGEDPRASRQQQISDISRGLKILAKELEVPVVALSQLNRGVEQRAEKRPMVSDLRESGAIEQDADVIMFIYRDEYYNPETAEPGVAEVIIAKQRNGPTGTVKLVFRGQYSRFDNYGEEDLLI